MKGSGNWGTLWLNVGLRFTGAVFYALALLNLVMGVRAIIIGDLKFWQDLIMSFQILVEFIIFTQCGVMTFEMSNLLEYEEKNVPTKSVEVFPDLDVYVPTRRVNRDVLEQTISNIRQQDYPQEKLHLFIADDTPEEDLIAQYEGIAEKYNVNFVHDPTNTQYKAGMLNVALKKGNSPFVAFFDYDQEPVDGILKHFIEVFEAHPDATYVQAKQSYKNLYNMSRVWSALLYIQVYEVLQKTKNKKKTVMFLGSTACFKRDILESVGGLPTRGFCEDSDLATKLMYNGHFGVFTDVYGSIGTVPDGYRNQLAQLWRWIQGGSHGLHYDFGNIWKSKYLNSSQKADITSTLAIGVVAMLAFTYAFSFVPLILSGVESARFYLFGVSSLILVLLVPGITYALIAGLAIRSVRKYEKSELKYSYLPSFLVIAIVSTVLTMDSAIFGVLGWRGPDSPKGVWTRKIKIKSRAISSLILGIVLFALSIIWISNGFHSAIVLLLLSILYIAIFPVAMYYIREPKHDAKY